MPRRTTSLLGLALAVCTVLPTGVAIAGDPPALTTCKVTNLRTSAMVQDLGTAVDNAADGDTLRLTGQCLPAVQVDINKSLTIRGKTSTDGKPVIDGTGSHRILKIVGGPSVKVRLETITLKNGLASAGPGDQGWGGAIRLIGALTLQDVVIAGSSAVRGGAISVEGGTLRLEGATVLRGNTASDQGGAIYLDSVEGGSSLTVVGTSVIHSNRAGLGGAIAAELGTILVAGAAQLRDNVAGTAMETPNGGGGAMNLIGVQLTVRGTAQIRRNKGEFGGAIQAYRSGEGDTPSRIVIKGSASITGNRTTRYGAAISASGFITLSERAVISGNTNTSAFGGAVETWGYVGDLASLTLKGDARIKGNTGGTGGGGVIRWTGCGIAPTLAGLKGRVVNNTPKNVVQYPDASEC